MAIHNSRAALLGQTAQPSKVTTHMQYNMAVAPSPDGGVTLTFTDNDGTAQAYPMPRHVAIGLQDKMDNILDATNER